MLPALLLALAACGPDAPTAPRDLTTDEVAGFVRDDVQDPEPWAAAVREALLAADRPVDAHHVCQVLATIEQESGYDPDPAVPDLGRIAREALEDELDRLPGPLGAAGVAWLLSPTADGADASFEARLEAVETERELDLLFRELAAHHTQLAPSWPVLQPVLDRTIERVNPVTTAGSMQVSVVWARDRARADDLDPEGVRDALYTLDGGVYWGTLRLFVHDAPYDDPRHRFADFNAGPYASRNAAFQQQLSVVTGIALAPDGDVLSWTDRGRPRPSHTLEALQLWRAVHAPGLSERRVWRDARLEKEDRFEDTATWRGVRETYTTLTDASPAYATVPEIDLRSPKITRDWTTRWFAEQLDRRFTACLHRD